jgi:hypothetical protein
MSQAASFSPALPDDPPPIIGEPPRLTRKLDKWRFRPWFRHGEFSTDWATSHFWVWRRVLAPLRGRGAQVLEIGSWEGRSAIFFLNYLRDCKIVCIDTFAGGVEHQTAGPFVAEVPQIEQRFDRNLAAFAGRVEKMTSASVPALQQLAAERRQFDLAYIDGIGAARRHRDLGRLHMVAGRAAGATAAAGDRRISRRHEGHYRLLAKGLQVIVRKLS